VTVICDASTFMELAHEGNNGWPVVYRIGFVSSITRINHKVITISSIFICFFRCLFFKGKTSLCGMECPAVLWFWFRGSSLTHPSFSLGILVKGPGVWSWHRELGALAGILFA
jgi:hypothetical protein